MLWRKLLHYLVPDADTPPVCPSALPHRMELYGSINGQIPAHLTHRAINDPGQCASNTHQPVLVSLVFYIDAHRAILRCHYVRHK